MTRPSGSARTAWIVGAAVLLAAFGAWSFARAVRAESADLGVDWVQAAAGPVAIRVDPAGAGWRSGLRPGDLVLTVDGVPATSALDVESAAWQRSGSEGVDLEVRRSARVVAVHLRGASHPRGEPYGYLTLVGAVFLLSGTFVLVRWPGLRGSLTYGLLSAAFFARSVYTHTGEGDFVDWAFHAVDLLAAVVLPALFLQLSLEIARRARPGANATVWASAVALGAAILWVHPAGLGGAYRAIEPVLAVEWIDRLCMLAFVVAAFLAGAIMGRALVSTRSSLIRGQLRWMLWGLFLGVTPFVVLHAFPWAVGAGELPDWLTFVAVVPLILVPSAFTTAIVRYRLHDLDSLLRRAAIEAGAVTLTFAAYAVAVYALRHGADGLVDLSRSATRYLGILAAALSYPKVRKLAVAAVERAAYRKRYSYRTTLREWSAELASDVELEPLLRRVHDRVVETLGVADARVHVLTATGRFEDPLSESPAALEVGGELGRRLAVEPHVAVGPREVPGIERRSLLFGMRVKGSVRAVLAVSEREDPEEPLSSEDRSLLATLAAHASTAIEAARLLREVRRQAEEVSRLHSRQRAILESSAVGLLMLGADDRILAWNRALEEMYGLPRQDAIGHTLSQVFPLHFVRFLERRFSGDRSAEPRVFRSTLVNRAGTRVVLNLTVSDATDDDGHTGTRVITFDDVSGQVKLEEQVLQQERLASLGLLAAGVAHEVNTPLTGISSYTQMLLDALPHDDPRRGVLEKIEAQTRRASSIANALLNLARPERSSFEPLSLNDVVRQTLGLFAPQLRDRDVALNVDLADDLPLVRGHHGKLQQLLLNLLSNARDAVGEGGRIEVCTRSVADRVVLEVGDNGVGIANEDLPRIFDPFFTTKGRSRGTGLGLSISYGIVQEHGGAVAVESQPGESTRFRVEIPALEPARASA